MRPVDPMDDEPDPDAVPARPRERDRACGWRWRAPSPVRTSRGTRLLFGALLAAMTRTGEFGSAAAKRARSAFAQGRWSDALAPQLRRDRRCRGRRRAARMDQPPSRSQPDRPARLDDAGHATARRSSLANTIASARAEADRVRDFLCLHYRHCAPTTEPFWKDGRSGRPAGLARPHAWPVRRARRLPYYEEETFSRDSWLAVLLGQGVDPAPHRSPGRSLSAGSGAARARRYGRCASAIDRRGSAELSPTDDFQPCPGKR